MQKLINEWMNLSASVIAIRQAQEENHRLGLPNIYSRDGKIIYEMPNGEIIVKETPENQKQSTSPTV